MSDDVRLPDGTMLSGGRYEVSGLLGQGGFGITYSATDTTLDRGVAIKEFFPSGAWRRENTVVPPAMMEDQFGHLRDRVSDEARVLARFRTQGIVTVHEVFEANDTVYVVMELLRGQPLASLMRSEGPLPEGVLVDIASDLADALDVVHEQHLLHRDIKPDNVMILEDGHAVLVDFGTARGFDPEQSSNMSMILTPGYAPLEQYSSRDRFGPATDVYALGATLYHAATGTAPAPSLDRLRGHELVDPCSIRPDLSADIGGAITWAMALESADRPQSAGILMEAIRRGAPSSTGDVTNGGAASATIAGAAPAAATNDPAATRSVTSPSADAQPAPTRATPSRRQRRLRRRSRKAARFVINIVIALIIGVVVTVAATWWSGRNDNPPADSTSAQGIEAEVLGVRTF